MCKNSVKEQKRNCLKLVGTWPTLLTQYISKQEILELELKAGAARLNSNSTRTNANFFGK